MPARQGTHLVEPGRIALVISVLVSCRKLRSHSHQDERGSCWNAHTTGEAPTEGHSNSSGEQAFWRESKWHLYSYGRQEEEEGGGVPRSSASFSQHQIQT